MSKKGTAISLKFGATMDAVVKAVRDKYEEKRKTATGWHGIAVVNVQADDNGKGATTYLVKGCKAHWEVFAHVGSVDDVVKTTPGKFQPVK
jgi:hypothetical protein